MFLFKKEESLKRFVQSQRRKKLSIAFVPTMGALHEGHLYLMQKAREKCDIVICSIFVNPTQFNEKKDLEAYPRPIKEDMEKLAHSGVDVLFLPSIDEIYPSDWTDRTQNIDLGNLTNIWEGTHRPGHFEGVLQVVNRLLEMVQPDVLVMGEKDYQQMTIISHMLQKLSYDADIELVGAAIQREETGLARSSRNVRLSAHARSGASILHKTLTTMSQMWRDKDIDEVRGAGRKLLDHPPVEKIEYLDIVDLETLESLTTWPSGSDCLIITAVWVEGVRLIDNKRVPTSMA